VSISAETWDSLRAVAEDRLSGSDPAHDFSHVMRVVHNARLIEKSLGNDNVYAASVVAALLHELVNLPKDHPDSAKSGDLCAKEARALLLECGCDRALADEVANAIADHAFSKGAKPSAVTAQVLQDADRLDAIGAIGIARCMATCASMKRPFYANEDPFCKTRPPEDKLWGIDHFYKKLLRIPDTLHTDAARKIAGPRMQAMQSFLAALEAEIG
jgi:uncharacterized protein